MADEQQTAEGTGAAPTQTQATAQATQAPAARTFSQEEVDAIVEARLAKQRARLTKAKPEPEVKQGESTKGNDPEPDQVSKLAEQVEALHTQLKKSEADRAFHEKVAGLPLSKEQRDILRGMPMESLDAAIQAFGLANAKSTTEAPTYRSPGAPSGAPEEVMQSDATRWSRDYISQLQAEGKLLDQVEKWRRQMPGGGAGLFRRRIPKAG